jgi:outer membrane biogenesis lipoprotein LolB
MSEKPKVQMARRPRLGSEADPTVQARPKGLSKHKHYAVEGETAVPRDKALQMRR